MNSTKKRSTFDIKKTSTVLITLVVLSLSVQSAFAASWRYSSWGRAWVSVGPSYWEGDNNHSKARELLGQTDDIKADGYCVYIRYRITGQSWPGYSAAFNSRSCGPIVSFDWAPTWPANKDLAGVRLYRGDGRYLTLWGR